jgi:glycosyltransferase involved in cell wall biosynthesis
MNNLIISAVYTSPPNTMGGNTKIMIELLKYTQKNTRTNIYVLTTEPLTFKKYLTEDSKTKIISIPYPFQKLSVLSHLSEILYLVKYYIHFFSFNKNLNSEETIFYSCSDWWPDVLPIGILKILKYKFNWVSTLFLFIPNFFQNIIHKYNFPLMKYSVYYFYQTIAFQFIKNLSYKTIVTNHQDIKYFPKKYQKKVFPIYGGVNIETMNNAPFREIKFEGIFCGRLHPQKGCDLLLRIWKEVVKTIPDAKLGIIGNGEKNYEKYLRNLVKKFELNNNVTFLGYVNDEEKYSIYKSSLVLLHTSVYDNNGMVAAEALCSGLPVVMFDHEYLKDIYKDACIKAKVGDIQDYSSKVLRILNEKNYYNTIKPKGENLSKLQEFWNWDFRSKNLYEFIN